MLISINHRRSQALRIHGRSSESRSALCSGAACRACPHICRLHDPRSTHCSARACFARKGDSHPRSAARLLARFLVLSLTTTLPPATQAQHPATGQALPQSAMASVSNRFGAATDQQSILQLGIEGHWLLRESLNAGARGAGDSIAMNTVDPTSPGAGVRAWPDGTRAAPQQRPRHAMGSGCPGRLRKLFGASGVAALAIEWRIGNRCVSDWHPAGESQLQAIQRLARNLRAEGFAASASSPQSLAGGISTFHREVGGYAAQLWVHCLQKTCRVFASETTLL